MYFFLYLQQQWRVGMLNVENDWYVHISDIGTHWEHRWIGVSVLPIPIWRKNYVRRCAELSPCVIAKILSLTADERQVSLLALINVPSPPPTVSTRSRRWLTVARLLHERSHWCQGNWSGHSRRFQISQVSTRDVWTDGGCIRSRTKIRKNSWDQQTDAVHENSRTDADPFKKHIFGQVLTICETSLSRCTISR